MKFTEPISFYKMSGSGNDFVIIDHRQPRIPEAAMVEFVTKVCARRVGVGADGLILIEEPEQGADFKWRFYNSDGYEAEMCGNGGRCAARFAYLNRIVLRADMAFETRAGIIRARVIDDDVKVQLTKPTGLRLNQELVIDGQKIAYHFINTGVPHAVVPVDDVENVDVVGLGRKIRHAAAFQPAGANVNFMQVVDTRHIFVRTYERGVEDETLACGTGTVAAVLVGGALGELVSPVEVTTRSGEILTVHFDDNPAQSGEVFLEGGAKVVYEGKLWNDIF